MGCAIKGGARSALDFCGMVFCYVGVFFLLDCYNSEDAVAFYQIYWRDNFIS